MINIPIWLFVIMLAFSILFLTMVILFLFIYFRVRIKSWHDEDDFNEIFDKVYKEKVGK